VSHSVFAGYYDHFFDRWNSRMGSQWLKSSWSIIVCWQNSWQKRLVMLDENQKRNRNFRKPMSIPVLKHIIHPFHQIIHFSRVTDGSTACRARRGRGGRGQGPAGAAPWPTMEMAGAVFSRYQAIWWLYVYVSICLLCLYIYILCIAYDTCIILYIYTYIYIIIYIYMV